jgi:hypothetical protein
MAPVLWAVVRQNIRLGNMWKNKAAILMAVRKQRKRIGTLAPSIQDISPMM